MINDHEPTPPGGATMRAPRTRILDYVDPLSVTGRSYFVLWGGIQHGGRHEHEEDAQSHAAAIEAAPNWDHLEWMMRHGLLVAA